MSTTIQGIAKFVTSGVIKRGEKPIQVITFRLERIDESGNVVDQVPVEIQAEEISGIILKDGDKLCVTGSKDEKGLFKPSAVFNETTQASLNFENSFLSDGLKFILAIPLGLLMLASIFGFIGGVGMSILSFSVKRGGGEQLLMGLALIGASAFIWFLNYLVNSKG